MSSPSNVFLERIVSVADAPECSICSERYDTEDDELMPRNLACGHSFCSRCIGKLTSSGRVVEGGVSISCPRKCSVPTLIQNRDIHSLPKNFAILDIVHEHHTSYSTYGRKHSLPTNPRNFLLAPSASSRTVTDDEYYCDVCETNRAIVVCPSCAVFLCEGCSDDIHSRKGYKVHLVVPVVDYFMSSTDSLSPGDSGIGSLRQRFHSGSESSFEDALQQKHCKLHSSEALDYFCETCCEEVCRQCCTSIDHRDHEYRLLADVAVGKRDALQKMIDKVGQCQLEWGKGFDECKELQEHLHHKQQNLEAAIKSHFHGIHSLLHAKEEHLLAVARSEVEHRSKMLNAQADQLAKVCEVAKHLTEECKDLLGESSSLIVRHADRLLAQSQQYVRSEQDSNPVANDCIEADFSCEKELKQLVEKLGQLSMGPTRVLDLQVRSTGVNELLLSWKLPEDSSPQAEPNFVVESSSENAPYCVVYEGKSLECTLGGCTTDQEDTVHKFRVAASNDVGVGPYSRPVTFTQRKASFLWDGNLKHPKAQISNNGYTVSISENATWVSVGTNTVLSHGSHYWEVVLDRYGSPSMSRKVVIGVVSSSYHHWHRSHGVIGIKTCPIGNRSWGLACGIAKKLSSRSTLHLGIKSLGRKHNLFKEGDAVGVLLNLNKHEMSFYRNGEPLDMTFSDVYGPVIPAISFCRNKTLTLRFPSSLPGHVLE